MGARPCHGPTAVTRHDTNGVVHQTGCGMLALDKSNKLKSFTPDHGAAVTFSNLKSIEIDAC
jgi:hypothetical protein